MLADVTLTNTQAWIVYILAFLGALDIIYYAWGQKWIEGWHKKHKKTDQTYSEAIQEKVLWQGIVDAVESFENKRDLILGVYVELPDKTLHSWNGENFVYAGDADELFHR